MNTVTDKDLSILLDYPEKQKSKRYYTPSTGILYLP